VLVLAALSGGGCATGFTFAKGLSGGEASSPKSNNPASCGSVFGSLAVGFLIESIIMTGVIVADGEGFSTFDKVGIGAVALDTGVALTLAAKICKANRGD